MTYSLIFKCLFCWLWMCGILIWVTVLLSVMLFLIINLLSYIKPVYYVPGSNLGRGIGYRDWSFPLFSSVCPGKGSHRLLKQATTIFQVTIYYHLPTCSPLFNPRSWKSGLKYPKNQSFASYSTVKCHGWVSNIPNSYWVGPGFGS
jgi:hypothetical protein